MSRDDWALLKAADPAPDVHDHRADRHDDAIADITSEPAATGGRRQSRRLPWLVPGVAAAGVAALAVGLVVITRDGSSPALPSGPVLQTCEVSGDGGSAAVDTRLDAAADLLRDRVAAAGGRDPQFVRHTSRATIDVHARHLTAARSATLCSPTSVSLRPVVAPPVAVPAGQATSGDPLSGVRFRIPTDEVQYDRLSSAQRVQLTQALAHTDCARIIGTDAPVRCETSAGGQMAYLLGSPLADSDDADITKAVAVPPGSTGPQWTVTLDLTAAAAKRVGTYTARHNANGSSDGTIADCLGGTSNACGEYIAFVVAGRVAQAPRTSEPISSPIQISGALTKASATALATGFTAAAIGLRSR